MNEELRAELEKLYKEVDDTWEELSLSECLPKNGKGSTLGYSILYSPLQKHGLFIIGDNPGGRNEIFDEEEHKKERFAYTNLKEHPYCIPEPKFDLAKSMRDLFQKMDDLHKMDHPEEERQLHMKLLCNSTKTNRYYFSSGETDDIAPVKSKIDSKSIEWTKKLLDLAEPKAILAESMGAYDWMKGVLNNSSAKANVKFEEEIVKDTNHRIVAYSNIEGKPLIGILHPSGARTRDRFNKNSEKIAEVLRFLFAKYIGI